jgi:hypothetical protein
MKINKTIFLTALCCFLLTTIAVSAQEKPISLAVYLAAIRTAETLKLKSSRREETMNESFSGGKLKTTKTIVEEIIIPGNQRLVSIEKMGETIKRLELIQIGKVFFRREDDGKWKKVREWMGGKPFRTIPGNAESTYSFEETKLNGAPVKVFHWLSTYRGFNSSENEPLIYYKSSFWVGKDGKLLREETAIEFVETKEQTFLETIVYQYNPKVKIEAPKIN